MVFVIKIVVAFILFWFRGQEFGFDCTHSRSLPTANQELKQNDYLDNIGTLIMFNTKMALFHNESKSKMINSGRNPSITVTAVT